MLGTWQSSVELGRSRERRMYINTGVFTENRQPLIGVNVDIDRVGVVQGAARSGVATTKEHRRITEEANLISGLLPPPRRVARRPPSIDRVVPFFMRPSLPLRGSPCMYTRPV